MSLRYVATPIGNGDNVALVGLSETNLVVGKTFKKAGSGQLQSATERAFAWSEGTLTNIDVGPSFNSTAHSVGENNVIVGTGTNPSRYGVFGWVEENGVVSRLDGLGGGTGNTSGTGSTSGGNVIIANTYTKTQIDEMFISKLNILKNEIYAKYDSINKNISDKLSTLETQLNLLTEKIDSFGNQEIPYLIIQNYLDQLSNCKLLSASFIPNIIVQNNTTNLVINLTAPAPKGGILVYLSATDSRINLPSSILINEGIQNFVFPVAVGSTMNQYSSKVSVTYGGKTIIVNLTIKVK